MLKNQKFYIQARFLWNLSCQKFANDTDAFEDHYRVLGVHANATKEEIKKAYRELSKKYHPDVSQDKDSLEKFKKISNAYSMLKDNAQRSSYTRERTYEQNVHKTHKYTSSKKKESSSQNYYSDTKADEDTEEGKAESRRRQTGKSPEQRIYEKVFQRTYKEDPLFYYKPENEELRKIYQEELAKLRQRQGPEANTSRKAESDKTSSGWSSFDDPEWAEFIKSQQRYNYGEGTAEATSNMWGSSEEPAKQHPYARHIAAGFAATTILIFYMLYNERDKITKKYERADKPLQALDLELIRGRHLKEREDKKEKQKSDFANSLALMKIYPRRNPNAVTMLVDYSIWNDIKLFHVPWTYFHGDDADLCNNTTAFDRSRIYNIRINTMLTLALESERVLKHVYVKVDDVLEKLKETGAYEPPGVFFRYYGYIYLKIRRKPIVAENLLEHIKHKEKLISLFDLFFRYTTPILISNDEFYEIPLKQHGYTKDTTTREGLGWIGNAHINHRPLEKKIATGKERNIFTWKGPEKVTHQHEKYLRTWGDYYYDYTKIP